MAGSERPGKTGADRVGVLQICELMRKTDGGKNMTASQQNRTRTKYKNNCFGAHPMLRMLGRCLVGQCWMNAVVRLSQSPQNGWETWFSCTYGEGLAKLQAPLKKAKCVDVEK